MTVTAVPLGMRANTLLSLVVAVVLRNFKGSDFVATYLVDFAVVFLMRDSYTDVVVAMMLSFKEKNKEQCACDASSAYHDSFLVKTEYKVSGA